MKIKDKTKNGPHMHSKNSGLKEFYDSLWEQGRVALLSGIYDVDPHLHDIPADRRFGLTLIVRPSEPVTARFVDTIERLREADSQMFYYHPLSFHFTVLSLIDASESFDLTQLPIPEYLEALNEVLTDSPLLEVEFVGVGATPSSIIAQGFPVDEKLADLREQLRIRLRKAGFGKDLDRRYRIQGAHVTLGRLQGQHTAGSLATLIANLRIEPLGRMQVRCAELVVNDFFMSVHKVKKLGEILLGGQNTAID